MLPLHLRITELHPTSPVREKRVGWKGRKGDGGRETTADVLHYTPVCVLRMPLLCLFGEMLQGRMAMIFKLQISLTHWQEVDARHRELRIQASAKLWKVRLFQRKWDKTKTYKNKHPEAGVQKATGKIYSLMWSELNKHITGPSRKREADAWKWDVCFQPG